MKHFYQKLAMTVAVLLSFLPASAYDFEADGIYYNVTDATKHEVAVTNKYNSSGIYLGNINIPSTVTNAGTTYTVTAIGDEAFKYCFDLTSITIPNSVMSIGKEAFYHCESLTSITIPNSVTSIGDSPFGNCYKLGEINVDPGNKSYVSVDGVLFNKNYTEIIRYPNSKSGTTFYIPSSVTSIANGAFHGCKGLTSITIPNAVTYIGENAFGYCTGLTSITIPNSVTSIGDWAFINCRGLTSINIPNAVTSIGYMVFNGCTGLTSITIPNSVTSIGGWAFGHCTGLTSVTIPNSVTSIEFSAFNGCTGLTSITIPNSVTAIGDEAFNNCPLKSIYCHWNEPLKCSDNLFSSNCYEDATLYVPKGCADKYKSTHPWSKFNNIEETDNLGIEEIMENQHTGDYVVYDLQGTLRLKTENIDEVNQLPAGLYIVNGKKVLIR